ncbi:cell division protein ZapD [Vibrio zhugei]|uniref:Cell division protein ZapD n=1 Tax=Vibrio zhugei TaxID=2479546 RepID=A0ABV7CEH2_9VIBR|nr:cell division protein ZapD [Vibrio zhugei]
MTTHKFEHPLNEKTRIYLRVEALLAQLLDAAQHPSGIQYQLFFRALFDLLEIFEQIQLKSELAKDIEKQRQMYRSWLNVDGVDQATLRALLQDIDGIHRSLMNAERFGLSLKNDRFLSAIRQRFNLPGGACCFDLPALHYWLHLPAEAKQKDTKHWISAFQPLSDALHLWLRLTRETGSYQQQMAKNGFYQGEATDAHIIRLTFEMDDGVYPMISGHKNRFAIKFLNFDTGQASTQDIAFQIAVCN